jgi:hypothetical protein
MEALLMPLYHLRDTNGHCLPECYACERHGLQERVRFTADYEALKLHSSQMVKVERSELSPELKDEIRRNLARGKRDRWLHHTETALHWIARVFAIAGIVWLFVVAVRSC